jgi:transcriptional regulator with XRE-family HTH domain
MTRFSEQLLALLEEEEVTDSELASLLGCSKRVVQDWLNGHHLPNARFIITVCETYDVTADWLLGLEE